MKRLFLASPMYWSSTTVNAVLMALFLPVAQACAASECADCGVRRVAQLGLFPAPEARALPEEFRAEAEKMLSHMELYGWAARARDGSSVGAAELRALLRGVQVRELDAFRKPLGASRFTAFFEPATRTIFVNGGKEALAGQPDLLGALALHELFGLAGVEDERYQRSALLLAHVRLSPRGGSERFDSAVSHFLARDASPNEVLRAESAGNMRLASGGTRVGGGGDERGLELKAALLEELVEARAPVEALVRGAAVEVEVADGLPAPVLQQEANGQGVGALVVPRSGNARELARAVAANPLWREGFPGAH